MISNTLDATPLDPGAKAAPLNSVRAVWTLEELVVMPADRLDELFRASLQTDGAPAAGQMPSGDLRGVAILGRGVFARRWWATFARALAWQGKVFDRRDQDNATLVNKITAFRLPAIKARVYRGPSRVDQRECIILDYSPTSLIARFVRDEIREVSPGIYLGLVFWGESKKVLLRFALKMQALARRA